VPPALQMDTIEEAHLLALVGTGDREAFRRLYDRLSKPLFSFACSLVGDPRDAEEVLQDSFVKIWRNAATYDPKRSLPFSWAVTITRRAAIDRLRRRSARPAAGSTLDEPSAASALRIEETVRSDAERTDDEEQVRDALANSHRGHRQALELALFSGLSHAEIARHMGQPVGTIKTWIRRGLTGLRASLSEHPT
jgi:RNA polymerase sigma-70 factor (ECF subfamily)